MNGDLRDLTAFEAERPRLVGLAYRITGSRTEADDVVQDAWLRWTGADRERIDRPAAWLTTVTSRIALDRLKAARHTREAYVGPWLPEVVSPAPGPAERVELAESLTIGFLTVLERLGPVERVVFLMADVFDVPFEEIAKVVDRSPEACRQVASRARRRVRDGRPRFQPTDEEAWRVAAAFLGAAGAGDVDGLLDLLAPDAVLTSDGGADHHAARRPIRRDRVPRFLVNVTARLVVGTEVEPRPINGQPGVVVRRRGAPVAAIALEVVDGRVGRIWTILNPAKLASLDAPPVA